MPLRLVTELGRDAAPVPEKSLGVRQKLGTDAHCSESHTRNFINTGEKDPSAVCKEALGLETLADSCVLVMGCEGDRGRGERTVNRSKSRGAGQRAVSPLCRITHACAGLGEVGSEMGRAGKWW